MDTCFAPGDLGIDLPFPEAAALAADCGFEGIAIDPDYLNDRGPDAFGDVLSAHGLRPGTIALPGDRLEAGRDLSARLRRPRAFAGNQTG